LYEHCDFASEQNRNTLSSVEVMDKQLKQFIVKGIAFHHAGLAPKDRQVVEALFITGQIQVVCATTTLAVGVNLPCRLVIIKGTNQYQFSSQKMEEYCDHDISQMIGRAGRPQFDHKGIAVIMTSSDRKGYFQTMVNGQEVIESALHFSLVEHLNSEITLGVVGNTAKALKWYG
jgi:ATP-dependent DNA helicase HFM1/MER3